MEEFYVCRLLFDVIARKLNAQDKTNRLTTAFIIAMSLYVINAEINRKEQDKKIMKLFEVVAALKKC